jgi:regulator of sigma E protease
VQLDSEGTLGFFVTPAGLIYDAVTLEYGFFESFPAGIQMGVQTLKDYIAQFKYVFTKEGASSLGGFGAIGGLFPAQWDWQSFWMMTAFLSVILAFMNILPIPALDGGHVMFLIYEVITRRKPNEKFMEYAQVAGMILLLVLVLYANGMDIIRAIFN